MVTVFVVMIKYQWVVLQIPLRLIFHEVVIKRMFHYFIFIKLTRKFIQDIEVEAFVFIDVSKIVKYMKMLSHE